MNSTTRLARAAVVQLLKRCNDPVHLVDAFGDERFGAGTGPHTASPATVRVHDTRVYLRILREGTVGLGESYADGWWDTDDLTGFLRLAYRNIARTHPSLDRIHRGLRPVVDPIARRRRPDKDRDARNVRSHYDLGNEFFQRILDETMMYSCAVFEQPTDSLAEASVRKLDRLADLLALTPDDRVLEIGTGWGGFAVHAARKYGCHVTTTTISQRQYEFARQRVENAGLENRVLVLDTDYRDLVGTFDKIIAIEMIEAVDWREYEAFFAHCRRLLDDAGVLAMQAIVVRDESFDRAKRRTDFIKSVIFPGGCLPSVRALSEAASVNGFSRSHEDDIGLHYGETLRRWRRNLVDARADLETLGLDETFMRCWDFYFSYCEAAFEERYVRAVQMLYTPSTWRPRALRAVPRGDADQNSRRPELVRT